MPLDVLPLSVVCTFSLLLISVLLLWTQNRMVWVPAFVLSVLVGVLAGVLSLVGLVVLAAFGATVWYLSRYDAQPASHPVLRFLLVAVISVTVVLLGLHALPGFNNPLIVRNVILSRGAEPFSLYLNFDKTAAGLLLLGLLYKGFISNRQQVREALRAAAPVIAASLLFLIGISFAVDYLGFAPKLPDIAFIWVMNNLFFVTLSEEAFFRGFLLTRLEAAFSPAPSARSVALVLSASAFGLAHFAGGFAYVCIAIVAGIGYGLAFQRSGRIEMAILTHFAVNVTHFFLFTYPRAA
jgi:uncharacterized protein